MHACMHACMRHGKVSIANYASRPSSPDSRPAHQNADVQEALLELCVATYN